MKRSHWTPVLVTFMLGVCGCLTAEVWEIHCTLDPDTEIWTVTQSFWKLGSTNQDHDRQTEDFEDLIKTWKGKEALVEAAAEDGTYIAERSVWVEGNDVYGHLTFLIQELPDYFKLSSDSTHIEYHHAAEIIETDGVADRDSSIVRWPAGTKEMRIKLRQGTGVYPFSKQHREKIVRSGGKKPKGW